MSDLALYGNMPEILRIQNELRQMPQVHLPVTHHMIDGVYVRCMHIPAGTMLTGKIHKSENIAILAQGRLRVADANKAVVMEGVRIIIDNPGVKRLGYAETDVVFITVHKVEGTTIEQIEKELVADSFEEYEQHLLTQEAKWLS